jgi:hypothetical protein
MSVEAVTWALTVPIGGNPKVILLGLANHAHKDGTDAYPSLATLATYAACDRSTARRNVRKLVEGGWIEQTGLGPQGQANYRMVFEGWQNATPSPRRSRGQRGVAPMPPEPSLVKAGSSASSVAVRSSNVVEDSSRSARARVREGEAGAAAATPTNVNGRSEEKRAAVAASVDRVWAAYVATMKPRRTAIGSQERQVIQRALREASEDECVRAIRGCSKSRHHMGDNDRGKKYNQLTNILKGKSNGRTLREQIDLMLSYDEASVSGERPSGEAAEIQAAKIDVMKYGVYDNDSLAQSLTAKAGARLAVHGITWQTTTKVLEGDNGERHVVVDRFIFSDEARA